MSTAMQQPKSTINPINKYREALQRVSSEMTKRREQESNASKKQITQEGVEIFQLNKKKDQ